MSAVSTVRYHVRLVKTGYGFSDAVRFLPDFKHRFLRALSASTKKGL